MHVDLTKGLESSFFSCEKDTEKILRTLFVDSGRWAKTLKRLLVINTRDCLERDDAEAMEVEQMSLAKLRKDGYLRLEPRIEMKMHEELKSYILLRYDTFVPNKHNPKFRDVLVNFTVICHSNHWDLGDYKMRPMKIMGIIDGLLEGKKLSGIGTFNLISCEQLVLSEELSGYSLSYRAVHGSDDKMPPKEVE